MIPHIYMYKRFHVYIRVVFCQPYIISACLHGPDHTYSIFPVLWVLIIKYLNVIVFLLSL